MRRDAGVRGYQYPWLHWTRPDHVFVFYGGRDPLLCLSERALYAKTHRVQTNHLGVDGSKAYTMQTEGGGAVLDLLMQEWRTPVFAASALVRSPERSDRVR